MGVPAKHKPFHQVVVQKITCVQPRIVLIMAGFDDQINVIVKVLPSFPLLTRVIGARLVVGMRIILCINANMSLATRTRRTTSITVQHPLPFHLRDAFHSHFSPMTYREKKVFIFP